MKIGAIQTISLKRATKNSLIREGKLKALHIVLSVATEVPQLNIFFKILLCLHAVHESKFTSEK